MFFNTNYTKKVYYLAKPYGRKKLAIVLGVIFLQGVLQVLGVTSIFPFLALASDPGQVRDSWAGAAVLAALPTMTDRALLIGAGCFAMIMLILSNGIMLLGEVARTRYSEGLGHWLRSLILWRIAGNPYAYFLKNNTGELIKKAAIDVPNMIANALLPLLDSLARLITSLFLIITLLIIDPFLASIAALGFGGFYLLCFRVLKTKREILSTSMKVVNRGAMREAQQFLGGIKAIKVSQTERSFLDRFDRYSAAQAALRKWIPVYQNTPRYLIEPLAFGGMVAIVVLYATRGENINVLLPKLGVIAFAAYRLLPNLQMIFGNTSLFSMNKHTIEEVYGEVHETSGIVGKRAEPKDARPKPLPWSRDIRLENLTFRYSGTNAPLFDRLSLEIRKNDFVALIGATGSGKSTLVDLLLGLHTPEKGKICVDDIPLTSDILPAWRAGLGYVPQDIFLLDDTIAANISFGVAEPDLARVAEVARLAQIADFIETELPDQYQSCVGERGVRLSGGQRQRIGLARALYHKPLTLVLDEATSALDDTTEDAVMEAVEALHGQITIIVIAHRLRTIERADHVFLIEHGKVVRKSSPRK